jgi:hypothetical protein
MGRRRLLSLLNNPAAGNFLLPMARSLSRHLCRCLRLGTSLPLRPLRTTKEGRAYRSLPFLVLPSGNLSTLVAQVEEHC